MEDEKSIRTQPSYGTTMDPSTIISDHLTIEGAVGQQQPEPQHSSHPASTQTTPGCFSTPTASNPEGISSVTDQKTSQLCDSADLQAPSLIGASTRQGRASKRIATSTPRKGAKKPRNESRPENAEKLLANPKAAIYKHDFDLKSVLLHEKTSSILPQGGTSFTQLSVQELSSAVASFKEDGRSGRHDPEWVRQALNASARRAAGEFDSYEASKFQETWGEDNPEFSDLDESEDEENIRASRNSCQPSPKYGPQQDDEDEGPVGGSGPGASHNSSNQASSNSCTQDRNRATNNPSISGQTGDAGSSNASDQLTPPPKWQITYITGDGKLEALFRSFPFIAAPLIQIGDVIRLVESNIRKDVIVKDFHGCQSRRNKLSGTTNQFPYLEIAVPPKGYAISEPHLREDIIFPNETVSTWITGLAQVFHTLRAVEPTITASSEASWESYEVYRQDVFLGTVLDLRQAWHFAKNEHDFRCQLMFENGRRRRLHRSQQEDGYHIFPNSGLYRKVRLADAAAQNHCLIIELGEDLNPQLAACAANGFTIVMYDYRILNNDGIPVPRNASLETAYEQGPNAFPTPYTREVASFAGWTKGHAHIGPLGLGKGWKGQQWSKGRARPEGLDAGRSQRSSHGWLSMGSIAFESCPSGHPWTKQEMAAVGKFHETMIVGRLRHSPLPRTKISSYTGVKPEQLRYLQDNRKPVNLSAKAVQTRYQESAIPQSGSGKVEDRESPKFGQPLIPSLPSGDARLAMAALFKKDPRRFSTFDKRLSLNEGVFSGLQPDLQLPMDHLASASSPHVPTVDQSADKSDWDTNLIQELGPPVIEQDRCKNCVGSHLRLQHTERSCSNRPQGPSIPHFNCPALKQPHTTIKQFSPKESKLDEVPWYKSTCSTTRESDFSNSVQKSNVEASSALLNSDDNPDSKYAEISDEYVLEDARSSNKEHEGISYLATYNFNDNQERLFLDAPYPPPSFESYFSNFDGSLEDRDHSHFTPTVKSSLGSQSLDFKTLFEPKIEEKVESSLPARGTEDQSSSTNVKREFEQVSLDANAEDKKRRDLLVTVNTPTTPTTPAPKSTANSNTVENPMSISFLLSSHSSNSLPSTLARRLASDSGFCNSGLTSLFAGGTLINATQYASPYTDSAALGHHAISVGSANSSTILDTLSPNASSAAGLTSSRLMRSDMEPSVSSMPTFTSNNNAEPCPPSTQIAGAHHPSSILANLPPEAMVSQDWQKGFETTYTPAEILEMKHGFRQQLLVEGTKNTFAHSVVIQEDQSISTAEYSSLDPPTSDSENDDDVMTTNENDILTPGQQSAFLRANIAQAIWFDKDRRPAGVRTMDFSQQKISLSLKSAYPNPEGFLSLPHYPNFMYPVSATPSVVAPSSAPASAPREPKRRKLWENEEYVP